MNIVCFQIRNFGRDFEESSLGTIHVLRQQNLGFSDPLLFVITSHMDVPACLTFQKI